MSRKTNTILKIIWVLLIVPVLPLYAQTQYNQTPEFLNANGVWNFGVNSGLNFNTRNPFAFSSALISMEGVVSVSSPFSGKFLFAAGGSFCRGANQSLMPNGTGLNGDEDGSCTQGKCAVPMLDSSGKYFLFSLEGFGHPPQIVRSGRLFYSIVDTALNGGLGDIEAGRKNILIDSGFSEGIIAIPGNNCDFWLLLHKRDSAVFVAYHIGKNGLNRQPVLSRTGQQLQGPGAYSSGGMAVSSDRTMVVMTSSTPPAGTPPAPGAVICKFDPNTGQVSDGLLLTNNMFTYSACFSPDNSKLYLTGSAITGTGASLLQFEVDNYTQSAISASQKEVSPSASYSMFYGSLKLYNDTIYVNAISAGGKNLDRINKPNLPGTACDYQVNAISLYFNSMTQYALPNDIPYPFPRDTLFNTTDTLICDTEINLSVTAPQGYFRYTWNDPFTGTTRKIDKPDTYVLRSQNFCELRVDSFIVRQGPPLYADLGPDTTACLSTSPWYLDVTVPDASYLWQDGSTNSTYKVRESGKFWVQLSKNECTASDTININLIDVRQHLGSDTILCREKEIAFTLRANAPDGATILWNDGSSGPSLTVTESGTYWVAVELQQCSGSDTINIARLPCECDLFLPNAFTPNGDGYNDYFLPIVQTGCPVKKFAMNIFNRYGQRIYISNTITEGWNGTFNAQPCDAGTYWYEIIFEGGRNGTMQQLKGDFSLLR